MPYTSPATQSAGAIATAAYANSLKAGLDFQANPPACRVYHSANQSYASTATSVASAFNSERYDTDSMHSTSVNTSRITINTAGLYVVGGTGAFDVNPTGNRFVGIKLNGSTFIGASLQSPSGSFGGHVAFETVYKFSAADYIELFFAQTSGGALNLLTSGNMSPEFWATWIGLG